MVFLNRGPHDSRKNGSWFHLDVHAPPRFVVTPDEVIYINLGDAIILNCQAEGTPTPEILWYKDASPVEVTATVGEKILPSYLLHHFINHLNSTPVHPRLQAFPPENSHPFFIHLPFQN